ncbi:MAG: hypothetical protein FJW39_14395 [Acidobacteria bacterium]|nr:hypothetical protein [Acidobacteriota bacterium]
MLDRLLRLLRGTPDKGTVLGIEQVTDPELRASLEGLSMQTHRPVRVLSTDGSTAEISLESLSSSQTAEAAGRSNLFPGVSFFESDGRTVVDAKADLGAEGGIRRLIFGADGVGRPWHSSKILGLSGSDES